MSKYFNYGICRVHFADDGDDDGGGGGEPQSPVNSDGTFVENWADKYPEHKATLSRFKNFDDLVTSHMSQRKKFGHDPDTMIQIPKDDSPDEIKAAFHKAGGKPDTVEGYKYKKSPDISGKVDTPDEQIKAFAQIAHKYHLNNAQFNGVVNDYLAMVGGDIDAFDSAQVEKTETERLKGVAVLKKHLGVGLKERTLRAESLLRHYGKTVIKDPDGDKTLEQKLFEESPNLSASPWLRMIFDNIAEAMSEDTLKGIVTTTTPSTSQISSKITEVRTEMSKIQKENPATYKNDLRYKELLERKHNLYRTKSA